MYIPVREEGAGEEGEGPRAQRGPGYQREHRQQSVPSTSPALPQEQKSCAGQLKNEMVYRAIAHTVKSQSTHTYMFMYSINVQELI